MAPPPSIGTFRRRPSGGDDTRSTGRRARRKAIRRLRCRPRRGLGFAPAACEAAEPGSRRCRRTRYSMRRARSRPGWPDAPGPGRGTAQRMAPQRHALAAGRRRRRGRSQPQAAKTTAPAGLRRGRSAGQTDGPGPLRHGRSAHRPSVRLSGCPSRQRRRELRRAGEPIGRELLQRGQHRGLDRSGTRSRRAMSRPASRSSPWRRSPGRWGR